MRWDTLLPDAGPSPALPLAGAVTRRFDTPEFRGITFHEVQARSVLNKVPAASRMPFRWTINPYRGCSHACSYCFARNTHTYLDFDAGHDFDTQIVVKVNAAERLRGELARPSWAGEHVAMGTNVDPYQRAEGRYRLLPGIIDALTGVANPFSILTKGTLILRDLPRLAAAAEQTDVAANFSVGSVDEALWRSVEPGTPSPRARLDAVSKLNAAGVPCGVLMAPILPYLSDSPAQLERTVAAIAAAGAAHVSPLVLHLRPGARQWYLRWLADTHPDLVARYHALYGDRAYAPKRYQREITERVHALADRHGIRRAPPGDARRLSEPRPAPKPEQLTLL
jgi:DNA repair photolyase